MAEDFDQLLARWGVAQRLAPQQAERISADIVAPPQLPTTWWTDFNGRMAGTILRSNGVSTMAA
jgi:hypothetical protein